MGSSPEGLPESRTLLTDSDAISHNQLLMVTRCSVALFSLLILGCAKDRSASPTADASPPVSPSGAGGVMQIDARGVGPIQLGMARDTVEGLANMTVSTSELWLEGERTPALRVMRHGELLATVELDNERVARIRVESREAETARGARVGARARELERLYGPGQVLTGEGNVCAIFKEEPGVSFCFQTSDIDISGWPHLIDENPEVDVALVVGR